MIEKILLAAFGLSIYATLEASADPVSDSLPNLACANRVFALPGAPFMHKIRTGKPQATVKVRNLPQGLVWNQRRSLVEGIAPGPGEFEYPVDIITPSDSVTEYVKLTVSDNLQQPVPFMGWLSWNVVEGDISRKVVEEVADRLVETGLRDAGYRYLVIDDLWQADERDSTTGAPIPDPVKFPLGIKAAADYVHDKNLKFGIYSDAGDKTCAGRFGSYGFEEIDADTYAAWDVDLLKYDYCNVGEAVDKESAFQRYKAMGDALKNSGRPILFYMCEWGVRKPWEWGAETGASTWRCTFDTRDGWNGTYGGIGLLQSLQQMRHLWPYSGVNRFNDADMMCVGIHGTGKSSSHLVESPGMTPEEYATQFIMWCMWSSPLTLSFDVREPISPEDLALITNSELIAINQDPLGQQAEFISDPDDNMMVFLKDLAGGEFALAIVNADDSSRDISIVNSNLESLSPDVTYLLRDILQGEDLGIFDNLNLNIAPHATKVFRLSPKNTNRTR